MLGKSSFLKHYVATGTTAALALLSAISLSCNAESDTSEVMTDSLSTATPELSSTISLYEIWVGLQEFYLGNQLEKDLNHAYLCVFWREDPTNRRTVDELDNLVQSYPPRYLPEPYSQWAKNFSDFSHEEIESWCGGMKQNIEERLMARAWDFLRYRRNYERQTYRADLGRWLNVAPDIFYWANSERGQAIINRTSIWNLINPSRATDVQILDQTDGDPLTKIFKTGEFELDVETWVACVDFIDDPTDSNISNAVTRLDRFLMHYYQDSYDGLWFGGEAELYDVVILWCGSAKGRIERRMVANLLVLPVLSGY